ncbi:MAG TPA: iron ABC transporter permease [Candidatus Nanopelagicales bacterium]|nr:iron ABC transporter permease [Candidatus Nanopelagicales bacterium]
MQPPPAWWFGVVPAAFVAVFFFWPLLTILARGMSSEGLAVLGRTSTWRVVGFTTWQALLSTLLTVAVGLPAAYAVHRLAFRGRRLLLVLLTVPFVLPTVVVGTAFRALLPQSWSGTLGAILLAHVFFNLAVVVRVVGGLWSHLDDRYAAAARTLGASPVLVWRTVTWPLLRPAVLAASALVFLFTFTSFGVIVVLGGPATTTIEVEIYRRTVALFDLRGAAALCVLQLVAVVGVLLVSGRLQRRLAVRQRLGRAESSLHRPRSRGDRALVAYVVALGVLVALPMLALLHDSLRVGDRWGFDWWAMLGREGTTTRDVTVWASAWTSLSYAVVAMLIAVVVGGLAACAIAYARRGGDALDSAFTLPLGTSAVTVGFGLLITFAVAPFDLRGTWIIVPVGQALVAVPLVVRLVLPVLRSVDPRLREAAASLGSSPSRTWRTVDLPVLGRALAVGAGFAAAVSLGEFGATSFLARTSAPTLPVEIARLMSRPGDASSGQAAALSVVLVVLTGVVVSLVERWRHPGGGAL